MVFSGLFVNIKLGGNMKRKSINKRLVLKKETIIRLDDHQLNNAKGGGLSLPYTACNCYSADTNCPTRPGIVCTGL